jgi:hypothetical protein
VPEFLIQSLLDEALSWVVEVDEVFEIFGVQLA